MDQEICICGHVYDDHDLEAFCINVEDCNCSYFVYNKSSLTKIQQEDMDDPKVPSECNRVTNAPYKWSNTPFIEDDCIVCLRKFASWN